MQRLVPSDHLVCLLSLLLLLVIVGKGETRWSRRAEEPRAHCSLCSRAPPALPWGANVGGSDRTAAWKDCPPSWA